MKTQITNIIFDSIFRSLSNVVFANKKISPNYAYNIISFI